jgi:glycosyltransferase involved in cell wall biosynthesis
MKIAAVCVTYLRPRQLGQMLQCFLRQDYADRELVILDDAGQYSDQFGDRWRLISTATRYASLGEKRNAATRCVSDDVEALAVWDDDDWYLPWALSASVAALVAAGWSRPSLVLHPRPDGTLRQHRTGGLFHGGWAYRREAFWQCGGYPPANNGEDQQLAQRLTENGTAEADPIELGFRPFYVYNWASQGYHLSGMGPHGYRRLGMRERGPARLMPVDPPGVDLARPAIVEGLHPRVF